MTNEANCIRVGAPYDEPAFEALCREMSIWGTAQAALCAVFWRKGKAQCQAEPYAWCVASTNSADWAFAATEGDVKENALLLDTDCTQTAPFPLYTAAPPTAQVPKGFKLVPLEPTPKMIDATFNDPEELSRHPESHNKRNGRIYRAMLAAAPQPIAQAVQACTGCNGRGEVGGLRPDGYHSEVCPYCRGDGIERAYPVITPLYRT